MSALVVVLDTCVLFPAALRDTLLRAAESGLYRAQWSDDILEELRRNLIEQGRCNDAQADGLLTSMRSYFPDASSDPSYKQQIDQMPNDPKDRHVLAAAVACHAELIITYNLKDFPRESLAQFQLEARSPDQFLTELFDQSPETVLQILSAQAKDLTNPPMSLNDLLYVLDRKLKLHQFVAAVREQM